MKPYLRLFAILVALVNLISIGSGIAHLTIGLNAVANYFGVLYLLTISWNSLLVLFKGLRGWLVLFITILAMPLLIVSTFLLSNSYSNALADTWLLNLLIVVGYFAPLAAGLVIAAYSVKNPQEELQVGSGYNRVLVLVSLTLLIAGGFFSYSILSRSGPITLELLVPGFALFFAMALRPATVLFLISARQKRTIIWYTAGIVGLVIVLVNLLPLAMTPYAMSAAKNDFTNAFGDWKQHVDLQTRQHFLSTPFSIPAYFLGIRPGEFILEKDVLFYRGTEGVDQGLELNFDAYMPALDPRGLPGQGSVLIRIHGGSWVSGDKGPMNMLQVNKYFAQQGYVVFDIQYGLTTESTFEMDIGSPDHVKGPFGVDDMVRHIGIFTQYLEDHADNYGANLNSVFFSGASAGGQLATAAALAYKDHPDFSPNINVRGLIPFYPANRIAANGNISGREDYINPELQVTPDSPPVLIFQGTHDSLVPPRIARRFQQAYTQQGNKDIAILSMPFGGHAADLHFSGYYNQVFLYYMERFVYMFR